MCSITNKKFTNENEFNVSSMAKTKLKKKRLYWVFLLQMKEWFCLLFGNRIHFSSNMSKTRASASSRVLNTEKQMKARGSTGTV